MPNYMHGYDQHLLVEPKNNKNNSFITNVNLLANNIDYVKQVGSILTEDQYKDFRTYMEYLDIDSSDLKAICNDLRKTTYHSDRQLVIDLVCNESAVGDLDSYEQYCGTTPFKELSVGDRIIAVNSLPHDDLHNIYTNFTNRVYYSGIGITTKTYTDSSNNNIKLFTYTSDVDNVFGGKLIYNADTLKDVLTKIFAKYAKTDDTEATDFYIENTGIDIETYTTEKSLDDARHFVVLYDNGTPIVISNTIVNASASNVTSVILYECSATEYKNYTAASEGYNDDRSVETSPTYTWDESTSALKVLASIYKTIQHDASYIEANSSSLVDNLKNALTDAAKITAEYESIRHLTVDSTSLNYLSEPTATISTLESTDEDNNPVYTNKITFGLPKNGIALFDTAQFVSDDNGVLYLKAYAFEADKANVITKSVQSDDGTITITIKPATVSN